MIEGVNPEIDGGRFPIKRIVGDEVLVEADIFADGHDTLSAVLLHRREDEKKWTETPMQPLFEDRWQGSFRVSSIGRYRYTLLAWVDRFKSWRDGLAKKIQASQDVSADLLVGAQIIEEASQQAPVPDSETMKNLAETLRSQEPPNKHKTGLALGEDVLALMTKYPDRRNATTYYKELPVLVDREKACFGTWYEMYPRSCASKAGRHGTFKDCEARLSYVAGMGFDVLYFPPIHPIGRINRKGKNNTTTASPDDPGSPWAIGAEEGGHKAIHPQLGTMKDFRRLMAKAKDYNLEIALDIAFHCAPDHPYVKEHPEWFRHCPDGRVQCAENPPNRYDDIYPFNFETDHWQELWEEIKSIVYFWMDEGIRIFRIDNPHTKPFIFWEWLIAEIKNTHPDVIFLAEAFTRPKLMYRLSKAGFTQSYTYFAWRHTKCDLIQYFTELTKTEVREYFRPSLWTNTPDNLTGILQSGGRHAFMSRFVLAATLGANCGIYGPAFELCENQNREPGSEEYLNAESYEIKHWDITRRDSLRNFISRVNHIRKENLAFHNDWSLRFHTTENDNLLCYSKRSEDYSNVIMVVANLDPTNTQSGWLDLSLGELGLSQGEPYQVYDLLSDACYTWHGPRNYVEINPLVFPAHIFKVR